MCVLVCVTDKFQNWIIMTLAALDFATMDLDQVKEVKLKVLCPSVTGLDC